MKTVAFVPIRLNSKRVVGKNMKLIAGRPLLYYVLKTLTQVKNIDEIYAYCSSEEIIPELPSGVNFLKRSETLDQDTTLGQEIYDAFTSEVDADIYVLAHTTSPFIKASTIETAVNKVMTEGYDSSFSAEKKQTFAWYEGKPLNYSLTAIPRTQDISPVYIETSAFFIFRKFRKKLAKYLSTNRLFLIYVLFSIMITDEKAVPFGVVAQKAMYHAQK